MFLLTLFFITTPFVCCLKFDCQQNSTTCRNEKIKWEQDEKVKNTLNTILSEYNVKLRPAYVGKPVLIYIDATILSFSNLDAINMMYTVDMYFRQRWWDHRLQHELREPLTVMVGTEHPSDIIWTPDTVFINSVTSRLHHVTVENHKLDIYPNGTVFWGTRITVSPSCTMDLQAYPMDVQECGFEIVSYTYDSFHVKYNWYWTPGIKLPTEKMAQFELTHHQTSCQDISFVVGSYTVLKGKFRFKRLMAFAILQIYIPSTAIVMVSWVSLWVKRTSTPARVSLCVTTLLTISTIWSSVNSQLPAVNYVKAVDIFLMTSFVCVIVTLLEYTLILNIPALMRVVRKKEAVATERESELVDAIASYRQLLMPARDVSEETPRTQKSVRERIEEEKEQALLIEEKNERICDIIERVARVFFPILFLMFNIWYWIKYLMYEDTSTLIHAGSKCDY